jgi:dolichyl-diphosphooligosaccharide--protein glycosyltransferase
MIFLQVKKQPNVEPTTEVKQARIRDATASGTDITNEKTHFLGCVTGEEMIGSDRIYSGGASGANYGLALHHAKANKKRYFAISRVGGEGHAFAFNKLPVNTADFDGNDAGCQRACMDSQEYYCGCADGGCTDSGVGPGKGQEHSRRWAIYERDESG